MQVFLFPVTSKKHYSFPINPAVGGKYFSDMQKYIKIFG